MHISKNLLIFVSRLVNIKLLRTMRAIPFLTEKSPRCFIFNDGRMADVYALCYDAKVDLENGLFLSIADGKEYKTSTLPTINDLVKEGLVVEGTCIEREYSVNFRNIVSLNDSDIDKIIKEFKENGFNVTKDAILHNFDAWNCDFKSGYRDEENNYHLFSPCGCNPLSFRASTLHPKCADWQTTYIC